MRIENGPELAIRPTQNGELSFDIQPNAEPGADFASVLQKTAIDANDLQKTASAKAEALARGATDDLHGTMISVKEAEISLKLVGSIRNRLIDAFHELWRINL
jgi:flagellar hook-basal body complex protein FliE